MRFIGCKKNILEDIHSFLLQKGISNGTLYDAFSGTASVASFFKTKGFRVFSNDLLYFSFVLQKAYIENNTVPTFEKLIKKIKLPKRPQQTALEIVVEHLNSLKGVEGFIYKNYTEAGTKNDGNVRMYLQSENGKRIDAIRLKIEEWYKTKLLTESEYYILLTALIEAVPSVSNISGTYGAFLKFWDSRTYKQLTLIPPVLIINKHAGKDMAFNEDGVKQCREIKYDIAYVDPPYNNRQYAPNYHILETIARYDNPQIRGVTGVRDYSALKSQFCNRTTAKKALTDMVQYGNFTHLLLSYNNEGIMSDADIMEALSVSGCKVEKKKITYRRYKSHNHPNSNPGKDVYELFYYINRKAVKN